jgi:L-serine dehydratase
MEKIPSIFNDIIGPVMRGPSSSHTAASWRIARIGLDILNNPLEKALIEFDRDGAWVTNYREQGTTMGIAGGLLGLEITDERMKDMEILAREQGISIEYLVSSFPTSHANTVRLTLYGRSKKKVQIVAVSLGGGSFQIRSIDGFRVEIDGDLYGMIFFTKGKSDISDELKIKIPSEVDFSSEQKDDVIKYEFKSSKSFSTEFTTQLQSHPLIEDISVINPIMPVVSGKQTVIPFSTLDSLIEYAEKTGSDLGTLGYIYEKCVSGMSAEVLNQKMKEIIQIIHHSIDIGLSGTQYEDRILPHQSYLIGKAEIEGRIRDSVLNQIIANVTALMESKSAMEVIVALPTAGSCGAVGGSLRAVAENIGASNDELIKAYFAAGIVGVYFSQGPGFSAEEHGCQVECGAASGLAAAALTQLMGGTAKQAIGAASMAIQNMIGLICDPVADRVEVPCLGKNINAAVNAYSSAIMAISGYDCVIPLNQVIDTVSRVSKLMPTCVKCTGKGGLAITEEAINVKRRLKENGASS